MPFSWPYCGSYRFSLTWCGSAPGGSAPPLASASLRCAVSAAPANSRQLVAWPRAGRSSGPPRDRGLCATQWQNALLDLLVCPASLYQHVEQELKRRRGHGRNLAVQPGGRHTLGRIDCRARRSRRGDRGIDGSGTRHQTPAGLPSSASACCTRCRHRSCTRCAASVQPPSLKRYSSSPAT